MARTLRTLLVAALAACSLLAALADAALADRAFSNRFQVTQRGDVAMAGNTSITCPSSNSCDTAVAGGGTNTNGAYAMTNVDVDANGTTFNSSTATLGVPAGATVLF